MFYRTSKATYNVLKIACVNMLLLTWLNCEFISCRSWSATTLAVAVAVAVAAATIAAALNAEGEGWYCWGPPPSCTPGLPGPPPVPPPPAFIPPPVDWGPPYPPPTPLHSTALAEASKAIRSWEKHVVKTLTQTYRGYCAIQILPAYNTVTHTILHFCTNRSQQKIKTLNLLISLQLIDRYSAGCNKCIPTHCRTLGTSKSYTYLATFSRNCRTARFSERNEIMKSHFLTTVVKCKRRNMVLLLVQSMVQSLTRKFILYSTEHQLHFRSLHDVSQGNAAT